jgi:hypothetical protein
MSDELNPRARAFLRSVQDADDPTRADYDRVHSKVKVRLAAGIAAGVAALSTSKAAAATAKVATATAAAASVAPPAAAIATASTGAAIAGKIVAVVAVVAAVGGGTTAVVRYAHHSWTAAPVPAASTVPAVAQAPPPRPSPRPNIALPAAPVTTAAPVASSSAPVDLPRGSAPPAVVSPAATAATGVVTASSLDAEIALVRDARAALRGGDAARSLALLDEHDRRFPGGALAEDCAAERIYALCALGNVDGARSAAARFLADHPYSPHAASVRASCAGRPAE